MIFVEVLENCEFSKWRSSHRWLEKKQSHDPHGNHAKHHQMLEETHIECWRKESHGDHQGTKEPHTKLLEKKKITWLSHGNHIEHHQSIDKQEVAFHVIDGKETVV